MILAIIFEVIVHDQGVRVVLQFVQSYALEFFFDFVGICR